MIPTIERRSRTTRLVPSGQTGGIRPAILAVLLCILGLLAPDARAQDWFRTGTGLGVEKARVGVADFSSQTDTARPLSVLFTQVVRDDLAYSGILELVSPSFYPLQAPATPADLKAAAWSQAPASVQFLAFGNLSATGNDLVIGGWFYDVRSPSAPPVLQRVYRGEATEAQTRRFAHEFADEIVSRLSAGLPGIAESRIAFVSTRSGNKEIWVMDYDGANQQQVTHLRSIALTPRWSPDGTRIAFTCYEPARGVVSAQICMHSMLTGKEVAWPRYRGTNSAPAWSPDGSTLMFESSPHGDPELFTADANGYRVKRITYSPGVDTSPAYNPKTGEQVVFVSDRGGGPQLYLMNADGTNASKLEMPDMGYVIDPAWSPNGQLLAFSWRRPNGNYDIYAMDLASRQLVQLTRDAGRNERPSWAPDGRHIVFESTRGGTRQVWTMLADGTQARPLTTRGQNESPNWSWH